VTASLHAQQFFAGFVRVGVVKRRGSANGAYGIRAKLSEETRSKSRFSEPVYYVFDNRGV